MKAVSRVVVFAAAMLLSGAVAAPAGVLSIFKGHWGNAIINTDVTRAGRALQQPTPEAPVYYLGRSLGAKLGTVVPGTMRPDDMELLDVVEATLARQGYVAAEPGVHDPTLFLIVMWGELEPGQDNLLWFLGYDPRQDIGRPTRGGGQIGLEAFLKNFRSREVETILDYAKEPAFGIIVTAFDYKTIGTDHPVPYWQTRIALPANGKSMADAMPVMVRAAEQSFGKLTTKASLKGTDEIRRGYITYPTPVVVGWSGDGKDKPKDQPVGTPPAEEQTPAGEQAPAGGQAPAAGDSGAK